MTYWQNTMFEEWRPVAGYEGRYEVSNLGRVKSLERVMALFKKYEHKLPERIMALHNHRSGYKVVWLRDGITHKKVYVQRLVANAFLIRPADKDVVNHIDRNKHNNAVTNLGWMTFSENTQYYWEAERERVRLSNAEF